MVRADKTVAFARAWGGPVTVQTVEMTPEDDAESHVVMGDILSPGQTEAAVDGMLAWLSTVLD